MMRIKFTRKAMPKAAPKGITPRRLAAQKRKIQKKKEALPLLGDWVESISDTPELSIEKADANFVARFRVLRDSAASDWKKARKILERHPDRDLIISRWNLSGCPKVGCYLLDLIRQWDRGKLGGDTR